MSVPYVAFDVETTGLIPGVDRILELAAVMFEGGRVLDCFQLLVDPRVCIPQAASRVNGITDQMVNGAPPIEEALPGFLGFLGKGTPVAHNATFDVGFITADARRTGQVPPAGPVLDTRGLARRAFPARASYSLQNLSRDLRLEQGTHRALADAHACRQLFLRCPANNRGRCFSVSAGVGERRASGLHLSRSAARRACLSAGGSNAHRSRHPHRVQERGRKDHGKGRAAPGFRHRGRVHMLPRVLPASR